MNQKKTLNAKVAREKIAISLRDLRKAWKKAGFLSDDFDNEIVSFKKIIFDEVSSVYHICETGC